MSTLALTLTASATMRTMSDDNPLLTPEEQETDRQLKTSFDRIKANLREEARDAGNARGKYWALFGANQSMAYFEGGYHFPRWVLQQGLGEFGTSVSGDLKAAYFDGFTEGYQHAAGEKQKTTDPYS